MDDLRGQTALSWLRALAGDVLEHESCHGCRINAAQALDELGLLAEVLAEAGVDDPRTAADDADGSEMSAAYRSEIVVEMDEE